jgi:hypothetical protein
MERVIKSDMREPAASPVPLLDLHAISSSGGDIRAAIEEVLANQRS